MDLEIDTDGTYYRVLKDTFLWKAGAILQDNGSEQYGPLNDLHVWDVVEIDENEVDGEVISDYLIEKNPQWFERVYPIKKPDGDIAFGNKEETAKKYEFDFESIKVH